MTTHSTPDILTTMHNSNLPLPPFLFTYHSPSLIILIITIIKYVPQVDAEVWFLKWV